jgi:Polysaccharide lyase
MPLRPTTILLRKAIALAFLAAVPLQAAVAFDTYDVQIGDDVIDFVDTSVKCSEEGGFDGFSVRRLVDCDSATLIEFQYKDVAKSIFRFMIHPFDEQISQGVRAELRDMHEAKNGEEIWYRFATLIPSSAPLEAKHRLVLAQWHERMRDGMESLRPPLSHRLWDGRFVVTLWNNWRVQERGREGDGEILFEIPRIERELFYDFVYKIKWADDEEGEIEGWMRTCPALNVECGDGTSWQKIIGYRGSTGYESEVVKSYYFKFGLYTVSDLDVSFTAFHKNYRTGESARDVGAIDAIFD